MSDFVIICDSTCDLPKEVRAEYNIEVVKCHIITPDKVDHIATLEWDFTTKEEYYKDLKKNPNGYSTAPASPAEMVEFFSKFLEEGKDVLFISISTGLSGTYQFSLQAKAELEAKYPERKVLCVDSLRFTTGIGLLAVYASIKRASGLSIDDTFAWVEENKNCCHQMGVLDDLSFVAKKGRMSNAKAFMGTLIGIKPLGEFDYKGMTTVVGKAKGEKNAYDAIIKYMKETIVDPENQIIFVAQSNRMKQAEILKTMVEETFHPKKVIINEVMPSCSINMGPGLYAPYYMGTKISADLAAETKIMETILAK